MAALGEVVSYLDELLGVAGFADYCPNGLQVEGRTQLQRLVSGVTASQALIDVALAERADAILVHHGYFWKGEDPCVTGMKQRRLRTLLQAEISLLAYHLPLDAHPVYGNNAQLARVLGLQVLGSFGSGPAGGLALYGELSEALEPASLLAYLGHRLAQMPLHLPGPQPRIQRLGWCTGAAQAYLTDAATLGLDAYLSGEVSERTTHEARELGIHYFAAGHHATERYGVQALGAHLGAHFGLWQRFIDIPNPV